LILDSRGRDTSIVPMTPLLFALLLQLDQGQRAYHVQDWPGAERHFVEALRREPANAAVHKWLGMTYAAQQKAALAEAPLRRACELDAKLPEACYYWGRTLFALGRFDEAVTAYRRAPAADSTRVVPALAEAEAARAAAPLPERRLNQHRVTSRRSPAPEPGAEREPIPSLLDGVVDARDWERRRRPELLKLWTEILGKLEPSREDRRWFGDIRKARILDTKETPHYTRIHLELPIERDFYQPHLLLIPKGPAPMRGKRPAVICWTSTTPDYTAPEQWWGAWLAERGYVVLTSWSFIRNYRDGATYAKGAADKLRERFGEWAPLAKMVHDARREAEFLGARKDVDARRIGFIGFSLGAKAAVYVAAFAPEIAATVALDPHIAINGNTNWYSPWYLEWTPRVLGLLNPNPARPGFEHDHHELLALAAPRPFLLIGGSQREDTGGDSDDLQSWGYVNRAREVYKLLGAEERIAFASTDDGHKPNGPVIDPAWQGFFERWLGRGPGVR
jgi:tetratricopeptide (TPR) repeat protein